MILDTIAERTRERILAEKEQVSFREVKSRALDLPADTGFPFEKALGKPGIRFICEAKKASPSKGVIADDFPYLDIARQYEAAGADAMSVLTEPYFFQGRDYYLSEIRKAVKLPLLRKDFTVDSYMIYQAKLLGADAILLICSLLSEDQLQEYAGIAADLGLSALVEAHDQREVEMAVRSGAGIIGVNNRNLKDFTVDLENSVRLRKLVPEDRIFVSESGMKSREDIARLEENGTNAVLIGETFMRSSDKTGMLAYLRGVGNS